MLNPSLKHIFPQKINHQEYFKPPQILFIFSIYFPIFRLFTNPCILSVLPAYYSKLRPHFITQEALHGLDQH